jgi:hypothetical protein
MLMLKILEVVKASGANAREAQSALRGAEAMIPELGLQDHPTLVIETAD